MNIRLLHVFVAVVRHQGYARAQQELNLTTSAISNYMSELEQRLGFVLCQRGRAGFALTPKGEQFLQQSLHLLREIDEFERQADVLKGDLGGTFRLAVIDSTVTDPALSLPDAISKFSERFPAVHINLQIRSPHEQVQGIINNQIDFAIGTFPSSVHNVIALPMYREQHWLYCSDMHPLFAEKQLSLARVTQFGIVSRTYWSASDLGKRGFKHSTASVDSMEAQLILILSGKYVGYLPEHYALRWVKEQRLRALLPTEFGFQAPFFMFFRRGRSKEVFIRAMRDLLKTRTRQKSQTAR
ncbi:LysR family transcriptional regulator [Affinibrenneria salicis]|nr:LysR family transcriptional regulator [Affinibrenneria salicis]